MSGRESKSESSGRRITISMKLSLILLFFFTIASSILIAVGLEFVRTEAVQSSVQDLKANAQLRSARFQTFLNGIENRFILIASRTRLRELVDEWYEQKIDEKQFVRRTRQILEDVRVPPFKSRIRTTPELASIERIAIFSADEGIITATPDEYFHAIPPIVPPEIVLSNLQRDRSKYTAILTGPIFTPAGRNVGMIIEIDISVITNSVLSSSGMGKATTVALARRSDSKILPVVSNSEVKASVFKPHLKTLDVLADEAMVFKDEDDQTLNAISSLGYKDWFLAVQKNLAEVYTPITELRNQFLMVVVPIAALLLVCVLFFTKIFVRPILQLSSAVEKISSGRRDVKVPSERRDEIGDLARRFNEMNDSIRNSERELTTLADQLREANANLKTAVEEEKSAREQALLALRMKDEFLAKASHELRTPIGVISGWVDAIRHDDHPREQLDKILDILERNAKIELRLIDDLLEVSRLRRGRVELKKEFVPINEVVEDAVETIHFPAQQKDINVEVRLDKNLATVRGDKQRLEQIVWNLLSNAVKFTPNGGSIWVEVSRGEGTVTVKVSDTGVGISRDFLEKIFQPFEQQDSRLSRKFGGLGIGLSIVKDLVEMHGGHIQVESDGEDKGATFSVTLPMAPVTSAEGDVERPDKSADQLRCKTVLIVDDMPEVLTLLEVMLKKCGAKVIGVDSAKAALDAISNVTPDVMICDISMPGKDGYDLIREIRQMAGTQKDVPAVALSAHSGPEYVQRALAAGFQKYLTKPATIPRLVGAIHQVVKG